MYKITVWDAQFAKNLIYTTKVILNGSKDVICFIPTEKMYTKYLYINDIVEIIIIKSN